MPTEHFKSAEAYRKWTAYRHIHDIPAPNLKTAIVAGKPHRVKHSELSLPAMRKKREGKVEETHGESRNPFYGE